MAASRLATWLRKKIGAWIEGTLNEFDDYRIETEVLDDICALARGGHPREMVAFLTGDVRRTGKKHLLVIDGLYLKGYDADEHSTHFTMHDLPLTHVYGTVHSHPGASNRPSSADRRLFFDRYGWLHLIICEPYGHQNIVAYNKRGEQILLKR